MIAGFFVHLILPSYIALAESDLLSNLRVLLLFCLDTTETRFNGSSSTKSKK
jgi:hypothetical protein